MMNVVLPSDLNEFVCVKVNDGSFANEQEVVLAALSMMRDHELACARELQWLRSAIDEGWQSAQTGRLHSSQEVWTNLEEQRREWKIRDSSE
jgi:putative addiction module CopG family antidote